MPYHVIKRGAKFVVEKQDGSKSFGEHDTRAEADRQMAAMYANEPKAAMRALHLRGALGAVRTEMWDGREHLVVPVVALQEAAIHAINAKNREFVPVAALTASVDKWNGHPLVVGHPVRDGKQISAHDDAVLAKHGFGFIRQAHMNGTRLGMEAMVDPSRLTALKQDALLADLRAGKQIEVSVGAFVTTNDKKGTHGGRAYDGEWQDITPDHLAFLYGGTGACSVADGCGAHRMAERYLVTAEGFEALSNPEGINQYSHGGQSAAEKAHTPAEHQAAADHHRDTAKLESSRGRHDAASAHLYAVNAQQNAANGLKGWGSTARQASTKAGKASLRADVKFSRGLKGASMNLKSLRAKMLALFDTPEQAASEEAAELVGYNTLKMMAEACGASCDQIMSTIDDLIADEEENPTETSQQEDAEEEVELARLESISMLCMTMMSGCSAMMQQCAKLMAPDMPETSDPRYMEAFRVAVGKMISAANMKTIQAAHDSSHTMHASTTALGAQCNGLNLLAALPDCAQKMQDCPTCDGTGQVKDGKKQTDCTACDGTGVLKAAASADNNGGQSAEEVSMTPEQKAQALKTLATCGCDEAKIKTLETDDQIVAAMLEQAAKVETDLKAAKTENATLKAAAEHTPTEEEFLKAAPASIRTLVDRQKAQDATEKAGLVTKLAAASKALTKEQLEAKSLDDLKTLAAFAKVETVDYSIKGVPMPRSAASGEDFTPPNPYEPGLKALQSAKVN